MSISSTPSKILQQATSSANGITTIAKTAIPSDILNTRFSDPILNNAVPADALAQKSQKPYSNKQFMAPFTYQVNVEGSMVNVDYLGKIIRTNNAQPYRAIVSLSAVVLPEPLLNDPFASGTGNRAVRATPASAAAAQQFNTGTRAIANNISGRLSQVTSAITSPQTQTTSIGSFGSAFGSISNALPTSSITSTVAALPGFNIVKDSFGLLPGGYSGLSQALKNPTGALNAASGITQTLAKDLNVQGGLPSVSLGSLGNVFSTASDLANSGPPTSLTGLVSIEKQVKSIICNFKLPSIALPTGGLAGITDALKGFDISGALGGAFAKAETQIADVGRHIKKEFEDTLSNIKNQIDVVTQLKQTLPDLDSIYRNATKELTSCDNNPNQQNNVTSGQPSQVPPSAPSISVTTPIANTGTGFGNAGNKTPDQAAFKSTGQGIFTANNAGAFAPSAGGAFKSSGGSGSFGSSGPGA